MWMAYLHISYRRLTLIEFNGIKHMLLLFKFLFDIDTILDIKKPIMDLSEQLWLSNFMKMKKLSRKSCKNTEKIASKILRENVCNGINLEAARRRRRA